MASRVLGLVRDQVLAYYFGAGDAMDAFRVAFRVPNLVRDLFAEGAMSAAFVPTFTRELTTSGKLRAWALANSVITALIVLTGILVVVGVIFAEPLVRLYAQDFADVPGKLELTVFLARLMLPFLTLVALAAVFMGMLLGTFSFLRCHQRCSTSPPLSLRSFSSRSPQHSASNPSCWLPSRHWSAAWDSC